MKKKTKIISSIVCSVILLVIMVFISLRLNALPAESLEKYTIFEVQYTEPLIFNGVIEAKNIETIYSDVRNGTISEIHVEDGQRIEEGDRLFTYTNNTTVKAKTEGIIVLDEDGKTNTNVPLIQIVSETVVVIGQVSEYDYSALSINQKVKIKSVSTDDEIEGEVVSIAILPSSDEHVTGTTIYHFVIEIGEFMQYGSSVDIELAENKIIIPKSALVKNDDETFVFLYEDGKVVMTKITYIEERGLIQVLEGLEPGNQVIENADDKLQDAQEVEIKE